MAVLWKTVRIFISSTFRDMHAERDYLVKWVFPELREWCEQWRLHLIDIDLRWGVTAEEAQTGKVLDVCLEQIDGSRPFFLGILGSRYGWTPRPEQLTEQTRRHYDLLAQKAGHSITHLEILHAVLQPLRSLDVLEEVPHAFFYFRSEQSLPKPDDIKAFNEKERAEYREAFFERDASGAARLDKLKEAVAQHYRELGAKRKNANEYSERVFEYSGAFDPQLPNPEDDELKGRFTRASLTEFGERVESDLKKALALKFQDRIEQIGARAGQRDPLVDERSLHESFIENRLQVHIPRKGVEEDLTRYADGGGDAGGGGNGGSGDGTRGGPLPLVLSGPPGSGKSSILASWVSARSRTAGEHGGDALTVARFIGASPASSSVHGLLGSICEELQRAFDLTEPVPRASDEGAAEAADAVDSGVQPMAVPKDPIEIQNKWPRFLAAAGAKGRVVLVLDAVNQLERAADPRRAYWIPHVLPTGIRMILSATDYGAASRPESDGTTDGSDARSPDADWLAALRRRKLPEVPVPPLSDDECLRIIRDLPSVFCKTLDEGQARALLRNHATRNPLFLTVALAELRVFGSFEKLAAAIDALPQLDGAAVAGDIDLALDRLFGQLLDRLDRDSRRMTPGLVPKLFSLLACARDGLSEQELAGLLAGLLTELDPEDCRGNMQGVLRQVRGYLERKQAHGAVLVDFYHRSFRKAVVGNYLGSDEKLAATHVEIAEYFETLDWFAESLEAQRARAKRLPPTPRPVTIRKVVELPWQRLEAAKLAGKDDPKSPYWDAVADLLTNWQFLEAKAEADPTGQNAAEQAAAETGAGDRASS